MKQTIAEWLQEKGRAEGEAKGRAEGRAEGALIMSREILRYLLKRRFGPLREDLRQRIQTTTDLGRARTCVQQAHELASLNDLPL